jgi:hypothetical protein
VTPSKAEGRAIHPAPTETAATTRPSGDSTPGLSTTHAARTRALSEAWREAIRRGDFEAATALLDAFAITAGIVRLDQSGWAA